MISSPDLRDSRSRLADWLELRALFGERGAGEADLASVLRLASDDHRDREVDDTGEVIEEEIAELDSEETIDRVSQEIGHRMDSLGNDYPFIVERRPLRLSLRDFGQLMAPQWTYLFLLILSAERDRALPKSHKFAELIREGRVLFHACASIGVAGLLRNARTVWFGFPRKDGSGFLSALESLCLKLGHGRAKKAVPAGLPQSPKDDQIDIVGWRMFGDRRNGNLIILCQAATGNDWEGKSIVSHIRAFKDWFTTVPYARATASIALPFPAHHEVQEHPEAGFETALHNALHRKEEHHGVLIDRLRIIESVRDVTADIRSVGMVDGLEDLPKLKGWVISAREAIRAPTKAD